MDKNDLDVGTGLVGAPACGDVMKLQVLKKVLYSMIKKHNLGAELCWKQETLFHEWNGIEFYYDSY